MHNIHMIIVYFIIYYILGKKPELYLNEYISTAESGAYFYE